MDVKSREIHVLLTSDTHCSDGAQLPASLLSCASRADHIVHAGDTSCLDVLHVLRQFAPITAVQGNVEAADSHAALRAREIVTLAGVTIGVVHDAGQRAGRHERLAQWFANDGCDVIVYGHTHMPEISRPTEHLPWICNPGSPVQRRRAPYHSVAWLTIAGAQVRTIELVNIDV